MNTSRLVQLIIFVIALAIAFYFFSSVLNLVTDLKNIPCFIGCAVRDFGSRIYQPPEEVKKLKGDVTTPLLNIDLITLAQVNIMNFLGSLARNFPFMCFPVTDFKVHGITAQEFEEIIPQKMITCWNMMSKGGNVLHGQINPFSCYELSYNIEEGEVSVKNLVDKVDSIIEEKSVQAFNFVIRSYDGEEFYSTKYNKELGVTDLKFSGVTNVYIGYSDYGPRKCEYKGVSDQMKDYQKEKVEQLEDDALKNIILFLLSPALTTGFHVSDYVFNLVSLYFSAEGVYDCDFVNSSAYLPVEPQQTPLNRVGNVQSTCSGWECYEAPECSNANTIILTLKFEQEDKITPPNTNEFFFGASPILTSTLSCDDTLIHKEFPSLPGVCSSKTECPAGFDKQRVTITIPAEESSFTKKEGVPREPYSETIEVCTHPAYSVYKTLDNEVFYHHYGNYLILGESAVLDGEKVVNKVVFDWYDPGGKGSDDVVIACDAVGSCEPAITELESYNKRVNHAGLYVFYWDDQRRDYVKIYAMHSIADVYYTEKVLTNKQNLYDKILTGDTILNSDGVVKDDDPSLSPEVRGNVSEVVVKHAEIPLNKPTTKLLFTCEQSACRIENLKLTYESGT